ncbi:MAG TPA: DUF5011 domain-containing protein [Sphingobacteriaceae bacterium]
MKRHIKILAILFLSMGIISCSKEDFNYPEGYVGVSKVTNYATFDMKGSRYVILNKGGTYTEAGVTAKEGDRDLPVTITGTVNTAVAGVYNLTYSAVNADGFPASVNRTVIVADIGADAAAMDLSGNYARTLNGSIAAWTRLAPGVYSVFNPGGAPGTNLTVIVFHTSANTIDFPVQVASDGGTYSGRNESFNPLTNTYSWVVVNSGYGTALRTFVKQ